MPFLRVTLEASALYTTDLLAMMKAYAEVRIGLAKHY